MWGVIISGLVAASVGLVAINPFNLRSYLWAVAGNSRTISVAYGLQAAAVLDEAKIVDWSSLIGAENGGRIAAAIGASMFFLRLATHGAVSFTPEKPPGEADDDGPSATPVDPQ